MFTAFSVVTHASIRCWASGAGLLLFEHIHTQRAYEGKCSTSTVAIPFCTFFPRHLVCTLVRRTRIERFTRKRAAITLLYPRATSVHLSRRASFLLDVLLGACLLFSFLFLVLTEPCPFIIDDASTKEGLVYGR